MKCYKDVPEINFEIKLICISASGTHYTYLVQWHILFKLLVFLTTSYQKESFHNQQSDIVILSE